MAQFSSCEGQPSTPPWASPSRAPRQALASPGSRESRTSRGPSQMPLVLAFAFIGGLLTIVAPCTLPIVPLVLGAGATGDYRRAFWIMLGFGATSVVLSVLLSSALVAAEISTNEFRLGSALALGFFGAVRASGARRPAGEPSPTICRLRGARDRRVERAPRGAWPRAPRSGSSGHPASARSWHR